MNILRKTLRMSTEGAEILRPAAGLCHAAAEPGTGELAAGTAIMFFSTKSVKTQSDGAV